MLWAIKVSSLMHSKHSLEEKGFQRFSLHSSACRCQQVPSNHALDIRKACLLLSPCTAANTQRWPWLQNLEIC